MCARGCRRSSRPAAGRSTCRGCRRVRAPCTHDDPASGPAKTREHRGGGSRPPSRPGAPTYVTASTREPRATNHHFSDKPLWRATTETPGSRSSRAIDGCRELRLRSGSFVSLTNEKLTVAIPDLGTSGMLRAFNERRVVDLIAADGPISRAQIARVSGLSKPTVSLALSRLEEARLVREVGRTSGGRGATATLYALEPTAGYALAFDVGRRWLRAALVDISGAEVARASERTRVRPADALVHQLTALTDRLVDAASIERRGLGAAALPTTRFVPRGRRHPGPAPSPPAPGRPGLPPTLRRPLGA